MQIPDTVIFDLGRVLVSISIGDRFSALMRAIGVPPDQAFAKYWHTPEVIGHMTGEIDSRTFHAMVEDRFNIGYSFDQFAEAWSDIFQPMPGMEELFSQIIEGRNVGLLSDTDPLHWARARELFPWLKRVPYPTLSFEVGYLKPHPAMYGAAAEHCGRGKDQCLFIDDLAANVDGARYYGMQGLLFSGADKLRKDLLGLGFLR